jgi:hypothetical protein
LVGNTIDRRKQGVYKHPPYRTFYIYTLGYYPVSGVSGVTDVSGRELGYVV